jgi:transcription antitermination factor NusG
LLNSFLHVGHEIYNYSFSISRSLINGINAITLQLSREIAPIYNTKEVDGLTGSSEQPIPISLSEIDRIIGEINNKITRIIRLN